MDKKVFNQNLPILALIAASIFGFYFRFFPVLQTDFPLNDGGFFVVMTEELLERDFILPFFTNYNFSQIPYAYPPLGFYLTAFIARITNLDLITLFRFLPAMISWLAIPAFYLAAKKLLKTSLSISIAVVVFAVIPRSWLWMIMGGGLTRALGLLFSILTIYFGYQLFSQQKQIAPTILCFAMTVLSHPEALIFTAVNLGLLFLFHNRTRNGFIRLVLVGVGALAASSPWWITVLIRHGIEPFMAATQTSGISLTVINHLIQFNLTGETGPSVFAALAVIGLFYCLAKKEYFLPISAVTTIILIPRSGPNYLIAIIAMLAALALSDVILPGLNLIQTRLKPEEGKSKTSNGILTKIFLFYLFLNLIFSATIVVNEQNTPLRALTSEDAEAMQWIQLNTPTDSRFLILSDTDWWTDLTGEWFPYLAERQAVNTLQGSEWLKGDDFNRILTWRTDTRICLDQTIECLKQVQMKYAIPYNYVYLVKQNDTNPINNTHAFELELRNDHNYELLYDGPTGLVFFLQPQD
jgi:hypothetical protein